MAFTCTCSSNPNSLALHDLPPCFFCSKVLDMYQHISHPPPPNCHPSHILTLDREILRKQTYVLQNDIPGVSVIKLHADKVFIPACVGALSGDLARIQTAELLAPVCTHSSTFRQTLYRVHLDVIYLNAERKRAQSDTLEQVSQHSILWALLPKVYDRNVTISG